MRIAESALDLIGLIYEAVEDPDGWPVFLDRLVRAMSATAAALHFQDLGSRAESIRWRWGSTPRWLRPMLNITMKLISC